MRSFVTVMSNNLLLVFFLLLSSFDSALVDIPCIVSGIGSILLFCPLTYTLDLFAAALHVHKCTKVHWCRCQTYPTWAPRGRLPSQASNIYRPSCKDYSTRHGARSKNFLCDLKKLMTSGKQPGLVVRAEDSRPRGFGLESHCILDGCKRCQILHI